MDKLAGAIVGIFLAIAAIYLICIVVYYVVIGLLIAAVIVGPPALAGLGLRNRLRRFSLSRQKVGECALLGIALLVLPLTAILVDSSVWPMAIWTGCLLGLAGPLTYLAVEGYRQVIWPHRKIIMAEGISALRLRWAIWTHRRRLSQLEGAIRREDEHHGELRRELGQIQALSRQIVLGSDPAFYSAEVTRWTRACRAMPDEALQRRLTVLPTDAMVMTLERAIQRLPELLNRRPDQIRAALQAAAIYAEAIRRDVGEHDESYVENTMNAASLRSKIGVLQPKLAASQNSKVTAAETIRQLRRERVTVQ